MGSAIMISVFVGGPIGLLAGFYLIYLLSEPSRWEAFVARISVPFDNRFTRWLFRISLGSAVNLRTIDELIEKGEFQKAQDIAVAEGLVDETIHAFERSGNPIEGARLARRMAMDELAEDLFATAVEAFDAADNPVAAAEACDEGGMAAEAVKRFEEFGGRASGLRAARIAAAAGMAEKSVALYLLHEGLIDAARTAEKFGMFRFLYDFCRKSDNPALHVFGAEAAARHGETKTGLEILEGHGHLHQAAQYAKQHGMMDRYEEILVKIQERKSEIAQEKYEGGFGYFGATIEPLPYHQGQAEDVGEPPVRDEESFPPDMESS